MSKLGNFKFFFHEIWQLWAIFCENNPLYESQPLFQSASAKILPLKKKLHCELRKVYLNPKEHKVRSVNVRWCKLNWKDIVKVKSHLTSTPKESCLSCDNEGSKITICLFNLDWKNPSLKLELMGSTKIHYSDDFILKKLKRFWWHSRV
jgi:hypothetical protein